MSDLSEFIETVRADLRATENSHRNEGADVLVIHTHAPAMLRMLEALEGWSTSWSDFLEQAETKKSLTEYGRGMQAAVSSIHEAMVRARSAR